MSRRPASNDLCKTVTSTALSYWSSFIDVWFSPFNVIDIEKSCICLPWQITRRLSERIQEIWKCNNKSLDTYPWLRFVKIRWIWKIKSIATMFHWLLLIAITHLFEDILSNHNFVFSTFLIFIKLVIKANSDKSSYDKVAIVRDSIIFTVTAYCIDFRIVSFILIGLANVLSTTTMWSLLCSSLHLHIKDIIQQPKFKDQFPAVLFHRKLLPTCFCPDTTLYSS